VPSRAVVREPTRSSTLHVFWFQTHLQGPPESKVVQAGQRVALCPAAATLDAAVQHSVGGPAAGAATVSMRVWVPGVGVQLRACTCAMICCGCTKGALGTARTAGFARIPWLGWLGWWDVVEFDSSGEEGGRRCGGLSTLSGRCMLV
jgi:hypothetical protein